VVGGDRCVDAVWLDELRLMGSRVLNLSRRHRCAAFADLSSDQERLGLRRGNSGGILNRARDARWIRTLTFNPLP
jgi:hypothetical protein